MVRTPARRSGAPWSPPARRPPSGGARSRRALGPCGRPAFEVAGARRTARGRRGNEISTTGLYAVRPSSCRVRTMVASAPRSVAAARRRSSRARRRRRRTMPSANDALQPSQAQRGVAVGVPEASVLQVCGRVRRAFVGSLEGRVGRAGWKGGGAPVVEFGGANVAPRILNFRAKKSGLAPKKPQRTATQRTATERRTQRTTEPATQRATQRTLAKTTKQKTSTQRKQHLLFDPHNTSSDG